MPTTSTNPSSTSTPAGRQSLLRLLAIGATVATAINLALWGVGRAAGASLVVDPGLGEPNLHVGAGKVVLTTLVPLAVGGALVALAVGRSSRWVGVLAVVGGLFAAGSAVGPLDGAHDTMTGVLLATMHLTTGAAFVVASVRATRSPRDTVPGTPTGDLRSSA